MPRLPVPGALAAVLVITFAACDSGNDDGQSRSKAAGTGSPTSAPAEATGLPTGHLLYRRYLNHEQSAAAIYAVGPGETNGRVITHPPEGSLDDTATANADGSRFAFTRCGGRCSIWTASIDGSGARRLLPTCDSPPPKCRDASEPVYSADGRAIFYGRAWGKASEDWIQHSDLFRIAAGGGRPARLTHLSAKGYQVDVNQPNVSPDGKRIVFQVIKSSTAPHAGHRAVFVMNVDGSSPHRLTRWKLNAGDHPRFSPDGKLILFRTVTGDGPGGDLYTMSANGSDVTQLTHDVPGMLSAAWSPDGKYIAFARSRDGGGQPDIWVMRTDGTSPAQLTDATDWDSLPTWGP